MKRTLLFLLMFALLFTFTACGSNNDSNSDDTDNAGAGTQDNLTVDENEPNGSTEDTKTAVLYFSATGNTKGVAEKISSSLSADLFVIQPEEPYTSEDLNYNNDDCRANKEQNDESARPAIAAGSVPSLGSYDTIFVGYPIWWGTAPRIIQSLFESEDFSGKTIYLFCTSGGSGIAQSASDLADAYPDLMIAGSERFSSGAAESDIAAWLDTLN